MIRRWMALPLIHFDLLRSGRSARVHIARWVLLFMTALVLSLNWMGGWEAGGDFVHSIPAYYAIGAWGQLVILIVACICIVCMSFSEERELMTFPVLLSTPLSSFGICFAKWFSVVIRAALILLVMMPFVSLFFAEGGLATEQIFATLFLTVCMVCFFTAVGVFSAVLYRSVGAGITQALCLVVLSVIGYGFFLEFLPHYLDEHGGMSLPLAVLTEERLDHIASWRAFAQVSLGAPSVMGPVLYSILLVQGVLHAVGTILLLWVSSLLLRLMERSGAQSLWAGMRRNKGSASGGGRGAWERGACRPWLSSPYVWRGLSPRASFERRSLRGTVHAVVLLGLLFFPYVFAIGVSIIVVPACMLTTYLTTGVVPRLPQDFPWTFGTLAYYNTTTGRVAYRDAYDSLHYVATERALFEAGQGWIMVVGLILLFVCLLVIPIQMTTVLPRERGNKRLTLLLSTSMTDRALFAGFWYEVLARWRGVLVAMAVTMLVGASIYEDFQFLHVILYAFLLVWSTYFWGTVAMYFGLKSATPRWALLKTGAWMFGTWVAVPGIMVFTMVMISRHVYDDWPGYIAGLFGMVSPLAQIFIFLIFPEEAIRSGYADEILWAWFIFGILHGLVFLGCGIALQGRMKRKFRHLLFRHA